MTLKSENARLEHRVKELEALLYGHSDDVVSTAFQKIKGLEAEIKDRADTERSLTKWVHDDGERIKTLEAALRPFSITQDHICQEKERLEARKLLSSPAQAPLQKCQRSGCDNSGKRHKGDGSLYLCNEHYKTVKAPEVRP